RTWGDPRGGYSIWAAFRPDRPNRSARGAGGASASTWRGALVQPLSGSLPGEHLRPEIDRRDPHPGQRRGGKFARGDRPWPFGHSRPGHRQNHRPPEDLLRRSGGPRRVRRAVLLLAPQLAAGGRSVRLDGGAPARNLRLHGGPAIFVARGIGSASLLGSRPDRNDRSARGQARARSGDL